MHLLTVDEEFLSYRFVVMLPESLDVVANVAKTALASDPAGSNVQVRLT